MSKRRIKLRTLYSDQFRSDAVTRAVQGGHVPTIAQDLGINVNTLYNWMAKARKANPVPEPEQKRTAQENTFQELVEDEISNLDGAIAGMEERRDALQRYLEL